MTGLGRHVLDLLRIADGQPLDVPPLDAGYWLRCTYPRARALPQLDPHMRTPLYDRLAQEHDVDLWRELATPTTERSAAA